MAIKFTAQGFGSLIKAPGSSSLLEAFKDAGKSGSIKTMAPDRGLKRLQINIGDILNAELIEKLGDRYILKVGPRTIHALGKLDISPGQRVFLKVLELGPPHRVEMVPDEPTQRPSSINELISDLKREVISLIARGGAGPFVNEKPSPETFIFFQALKALLDLEKGHGHDRKQGIEIMAQLHRVHGLETRIRNELGHHVGFIPFYFAEKAGGGLLKISERYHGGDGDTGRGSNKDHLLLEFDLYLTRLGPLNIRCLLRENAVDFSMRAEKPVLELAKDSMDFLGKRLKELGFVLDGVSLIPCQPDSVGYVRGQGSIHFVV